MAKHTRLHRRKNSRNYQFRAKIPIDLQDHYGKKEIKFSLRTGDYREALEKVRIESVKLDQEFATARRKLTTQPTQAIDKLSPMEIERLAAITYHDHLKEDEIKRTLGMSEEERMHYAELLQTLDFEFRERISHGDVKSVEDYAEELLAHQGITMDKGSDNFKELAIKLLEALGGAYKAMRERHQGQVVSTPFQPGNITNSPDRPKAALMSIEDAVEKYIDWKINGPKPWALSSKKDISPQVRQFAEIVGKNKLIGDLNRDDMRLYWKLMMKLPAKRMSKPYRGKSLKQLLKMNIPEGESLSPKTLNTRFTNIKTFLNWAELEGCVDRARPLNVILIAPAPKPDAPQRQNFSHDELVKLFHSDRYGRGKLFTKPWHYWVPLLALFTGARAEELAQLHISDIKQVDDVWVLDINEIGDKRVKTKAGRRHVPIHPFLLNDLKFLDFVDSSKNRDSEQLFKELKIRKSSGNRSGTVSQWFTRYRRTCEVGAMQDEGISSLTFHSFRHTMITWCKHHDVDRAKCKEAVGHEQGEVRDVTNDYEAAYPVAMLLRDVIKPLDFHTSIPLDHLKK